MDIAELVLDYIRTLIWPCVVVVFIWIFRAKVAELLERLSEVGGGGFNAKFDQAAAAITRDAVAPRTETSPSTTPEHAAKSARPENVVNIDMTAFRDTTAVLSAYNDNKIVDVDLTRLSESEAIQVLAFLTGVVRGTAGFIAQDRQGPRRYALFPPGRVNDAPGA